MDCGLLTYFKNILLFISCWNYWNCAVYLSFRKLMEKENILFCNKVMLTSSGLGIFVCFFFFFNRRKFGGDIMSAFNFELLKLASNTTVGQVAILTIIAHTLFVVQSLSLKLDE